MPAVTVPPGVEGIVSIQELPDPAWQSRWDRIVVAADDQGPAPQLHAVLAWPARPNLRRGPAGSRPRDPGRAAGHGQDHARRRPRRSRRARDRRRPLLFVEINPHAFPSQMLGESQRAAARLFERTIPDLAQRGQPTIVLLDEVEALAVSRTGRRSRRTRWTCIAPRTRCSRASIWSRARVPT